ncbi:MAG: matrixin family metalloprotease [Acidobacteriota bacterium]
MRTLVLGAGRVFLLAVGLTAMSPLVSAYYYYVFFASGTGPYAPLAAHFDLNAIQDNTVQYFISDQTPGPLMPGDNLTAIYSQILQAAEVWNNIATSSLRLHFGGARNMASPQAVPGIDVVFDDNMPPGIVAQTKVIFPADLTFLSAKGTSFVPILRSKVQMRKDLTAAGYQQASYTDAFFMTLVHEFGHSLGLQHTFTSATMSTAITRATTRGAPLAADDVSGISLLYPAGGYAAVTGSIMGQVKAPNGAAINLASVVALSTNGVAISGMTRPDGTYEIDGIPPGQYYVYAHPLPPAFAGEGTPANIVTPADPQNDTFAANTGFVTQFFPGTQDWTQAVPVGVAGGKAVSEVNFAVTASAGPAVYAMETYGYPQGVAIPAPPFTPKTRNGLVFYANGATVNNLSAMAPGLTASIIGSAASLEPGSPRYFANGFLLAWVDTADIKVETPVALAVRLDGDLYVLPAAFTVVPGGPPSIFGVTPPASASPVATRVTGANLTASTRILFDGAPAQVLAANEDGSLDIVQPPALSGMQATVEAVNPDGQTSLQSLVSTPAPMFTFPQSNPPQIFQTPNTVTAGTDTLLVISGIDTHFAEGRTVVGFGSSDISVRGKWVVNSSMVILNLTVDPAAQPGTTYITVATGLEIVTAPYMLNIAAASPNQTSLRVPIRNAVTGLAGIPAGGIARIGTAGLPADLTGWTLTVGSLPAAFTADANGVLTVQVPSQLAVGQQPVQLNAPPNSTVAAVPRVILQLDPAPPLILWGVDTPVVGGGPVLLSASNPAPLGGSVVVMVYGLSSPSGVLPSADAVWMNIEGVIYPVTAVTQVPADPNSTAPPPDLAYVSFVVPATLVLDPTVSNPAVPVMVGTGTRQSGAYSLFLAPALPPPVTAAP